MSNSLWTKAGLVMLGAAIAAFLASPVSAGGKCPMAKGAKTECHEKCVKDLSSALTGIDEVTKYVQAGEKDKALAELKKIRGIIEVAYKAFSEHKTALVVNGWDPITGKAFDPYTVSADRIRDYNGHKLGFYSPGTAKQWDKLPAADKEKDFGRVSHHEGHAMAEPSCR